jgi:hypothetical protein
MLAQKVKYYALNGNQQRMVNPANFTPRQDLGETDECTSYRRGISYSAREAGHIGLVDALNSEAYDDAHW